MGRTFLAALIGWVAVISFAAAQPDTLWTKIIGGIYNDVGRSVQQTSDGGYIIGGWTDSFGAGGYDVYLIKTDEDGDTIWTRTFGGVVNDYGYSVLQTSDGGYVITGYTASFGAGYCDVYLIKTDEDGNEVWSQTLGGSFDECGYSVQQTSDGGYIITGFTCSYGAGWNDVYLAKTDAEGNHEWSRPIGGSDDECGYSVQQTSDGGYVIAGWTESFGVGAWDDIYLIKTDGDGTIEWTQTIGGSNDEWGYGVQQTPDGGCVITGFTFSFGAGSNDVYLVRTDGDGNELWSRTFGGSGGECGYSIQQTSDGGYIISGQTNNAGNYDVYLIKTDGIGNEMWTQAYGGIDSEEGYCVQQTSDGGYIITGSTRPTGGGFENILLIRLASDFSVKPENSKQAYKFQLIPAYPNPFNPTTTLRFDLPAASGVKLLIYDISGIRVAQLVNGWRFAGRHQVTFDASDLASGLYIARLQAGSFSEAQKIVLMK